MDHKRIGLMVEEHFKTKDFSIIYKHIDNVNVTAKFSTCLKYRYRLDIALKTPTKEKNQTVCVVLQNPSDATEDIADKSVQFIEKLVFTKNIPQFSNVNKLIIVNQFAFIQKNGFKGTNRHIGGENDAFIKKAFSEADIILIAWGSANPYKTRKLAINQMLAKHNNKTLLQGKCHPSRGSYSGCISQYTI